MNKVRRKKLSKVIDSLKEASGIISFELSQEECSMDNYPEKMQNCQKYYDIENAVDVMTDAIDALDGVIDLLVEII